jgi:hypothetical protein
LTYDARCVSYPLPSKVGLNWRRSIYFSFTVLSIYLSPFNLFLFHTWGDSTVIESLS